MCRPQTPQLRVREAGKAAAEDVALGRWEGTLLVLALHFR
jgi:hypothetical protein